VAQDLGSRSLISRKHRPTGILATIGALLVLTASAVVALDTYRLKARLKTKQCTTTEGFVENFHDGGRGSDFESFSVNGTTYRFSEYEVQNGYHRYHRHGGAVGPGMMVRLCCLGSTILAVDVADR